MSKSLKRNYPITTDNVRNLGGKELILNRMVNHYNALANIKPYINIVPPHPGVKKTKHDINHDINKKEDFRNVREAYKAVSSVKPYVDNKKPFTYDKRPKGIYNTAKERYEKMEHLRILEAMSKRILSIGKMHERKKNKDDPIANPTYFFRNIKDKDSDSGKAIKLISLRNLNKTLKEINNKERNRLLLNEEIYQEIKNKGNNVLNNRAKTALERTAYPHVTIPKQKYSYYVEYKPDEYIKYHKLNRESDGKKIVEKFKRNKEIRTKTVKENKSKILKNLIHNKKLPVFDKEDNGEQFEKDILQFVIKNRVISDDDFDLLYGGLIEKNKDIEGVDEIYIKQIIERIKDDLDN
jgi:hypothetical protein